MSQTQTVIPQLIERVVELTHPLKIIVFGSAAKGDIETANDIDLLVVMPEGTHRRRTAQLLYRRLTGIGAAFDILVATPRDLQEQADNIGLIYRTVLREGREVYAAPDRSG
jgi:predicted nucleotidyltransferase